MTTKPASPFAFAAVLLLGAAVLFSAATLAAAAGAGTPFGTSRADVEKLMLLNDSTQLTPAQQRVFKQALDALPAPCCKEFSAATCCCQCNMARATWGLAKHLIADRGQGVEQVRGAVKQWHAAINPDGFSGGACFTGGCARPFRHDGCGGMKREALVH